MVGSRSPGLSWPWATARRICWRICASTGIGLSGSIARRSSSRSAMAPCTLGRMEKTKEEVAILAGGCFWGMEEIIRNIPGVLNTEVGYTGGTTAGPRYEDVKTGRTGHAESIQVVFNPDVLSYQALLGWFFRMH